MDKLYVCRSGEVVEVEIEKETLKQIKVRASVSTPFVTIKKDELDKVKDDVFIWFYVASRDRNNAIRIYNEYIEKRIPLIQSE